MGQPTPMGQPPYPAVPSRPTRTRMFYIASDEVTNTILVTGPPEIIAKAKDIVENRLDKPNPDVKNPQPILTGPPSFENIPLLSGNADAVAKDLQGVFAATSTLRISSNGPNALRVFACPEDMDRIKGYIQQIQGKGAKGELVDVGGLDVAKAATTLQNILGDPTKGGGPYIEAMPDNNGVFVNGTAEQVQQVKDLIKVMNGGSAAPGIPGTNPGGVGPGLDLKPGAFRVVTLDKGQRRGRG